VHEKAIDERDCLKSSKRNKDFDCQNNTKVR